MTSAEQQHSVDAAALASKHDQEIAELEDIKFALFEEFDARRAAWAGKMGKLMTEASLMHTKAVKELIVQGSRKASELQNPHFITAETSTVRRERYCKQAERRASLEKDLKLRQLESKNQYRPARTEIENEYQVRLGELQQRLVVFQKRQANELKILANQPKIVHVEALVAFVLAETKLEDSDERRGESEWWSHLNNEAAICRQQIDEEERYALAEIDLAVKVEAEKLVAPTEAQRLVVVETATAASAVDFDMVSSFKISPTWVNVVAGWNTDSSDETLSDAPRTLDVARHFGMTAAPNIVMDGLGDRDDASVTSLDEIEHSISPPAFTASMLINARMTTSPHSAFTDVEDSAPSEGAILSCSGGPFIHVEIDSTLKASDRSNSHSSFSSGSEFVEIWRFFPGDSYPINNIATLVLHILCSSACLVKAAVTCVTGRTCARHPVNSWPF